MFDPRRRTMVPVLLVLIATWAPSGALAQTPPAVHGVEFNDVSTLAWDPVLSADTYNVYRGIVGELGLGQPARCHGFAIDGTSFTTPERPDSGAGYFFLVTAESASSGEGSAGFDSFGVRRPLLGPCTPIMRTHVLNRVGYGWGEWSAASLDSLGLDGYIASQLNPLGINELDNTELYSQLGPITPPANIAELVQHQVLRAVYSRRQLEQQVASFWANHFNTGWSPINVYYQTVFPKCLGGDDPPQCDPGFPSKALGEASSQQHNEIQSFRRTAFEGNFRDLVEDSALSPAMIVYLDAYTSVAGNPNQNYPRELMELHTLGVDGGYTQVDVEELSRTITGWSVCKKVNTDVDDPLAPCIVNYWEDLPAGRFAAHFDPALHDCTAKTLFLGTPQQFTIPDTCAQPVDGLDDLFLALDHIVAHPSTARFISRKLLQRFVTDEPDEAMVDAVVAVWEDAGNPQGVGDLRAVLAAVLQPGLLLDPDHVHSKIKTPLEHAASLIRGTKGQVNGLAAVVNFLNAAQHVPHFNPVPTGWPEDGPSWIDTGNTLERQNLAFNLLTSTDPDFSADPVQLLADYGVSTAPGNAEPIVDFFIDVLLGGYITPDERQQVIDFLTTDATGTPSPYHDTRIRKMVAMLAGFPHFQEQ